MKRRLNLSMGLLHRPRVLLLDEPTVGIDPQARLNILEVVREVAASGTTVLYTTHYMEEAQDLCDRIAIIDHGRILTVGTLDELTRLAGEAEVLRLSGRFDDETARVRLGVAFGGWFSDPDRAANVGVMTTMAMAAFGGCWWPIEVVSKPLKTVSLMLPSGWAMRALHGLISFGRNLTDLGPELLALLVFGAAFSFLAARSLRID